MKSKRTEDTSVASHSEPKKQGSAPEAHRGLGPLQYLFLLPIRAYRLFLSPWIGYACRYQPTCSAYAMDAITRYGACRGGWLALKRIARCHPWGGSGHDPVP